MPTTELTASEIRAYLTQLQRALGEGTVELHFSDGRSVRYTTPDEKRTAIGYFESLLASVESGISRPRRLILSSASGVE